MADAEITRQYRRRLELKYGCNPHQAPAAIFTPGKAPLPFRVLNGNPGYINLLDALNGWQLVRELRSALGKPAAASFKHVSPAGAAVGEPLEPVLAEIYGVGGQAVTPLEAAFRRARGADPLSSYGDFLALSDPMDEGTARALKGAVSDGVIAPGFEEKALGILKGKKGGGFIVLEVNAGFSPPAEELREVFGVVFSQHRNEVEFGAPHLENRVTAEKTIPPEALRDLIVAAIAVKYTQSNSVGYALGGQMIGVGAGQQSRVDCTRLAGKKAETWFLRQHPRVRELRFRSGVKGADRTNARVRFIQGDFTGREWERWGRALEEVPPMLEESEKREWLEGLRGVSLASDAFFPFRDSIDYAAQRGVKFVVQPGGSIADDEVIEACNEYGLVMAFSGVRLFHH